MKLIGLLGGMSWESTALYYSVMNEEVRARLGGLHSARVLLHSVDFQQIETLQHQGDWLGTANVLGQAAHGLAQGGADFLVIATNTMHIVAEKIAAQSGLDILHIADPTAEALIADGYDCVGLLGTAFTMQETFYTARLEAKGLQVLVPDVGQTDIHQIIYKELCLGIVREESRAIYVRAIERLAQRGAQAVILGCTEIGMLIDDSVSPIPTFDTTELHAKAAVVRALT